MRARRPLSLAAVLRLIAHVPVRPVVGHGAPLGVLNLRVSQRVKTREVAFCHSRDHLMNRLACPLALSPVGG